MKTLEISIKGKAMVLIFLILLSPKLKHANFLTYDAFIINLKSDKPRNSNVLGCKDVVLELNFDEQDEIISSRHQDKEATVFEYQHISIDVDSNAKVEKSSLASQNGFETTTEIEDDRENESFNSSNCSTYDNLRLNRQLSLSYNYFNS